MDKEILIAGGLAAITLLFKKKAPDFQPATTGGVIGKSYDNDLQARVAERDKLENIFSDTENNLSATLGVPVSDVQNIFEFSDDSKSPEISLNVGKIENLGLGTEMAMIGYGILNAAIDTIETFSRPVTGIFGKTANRFFNIGREHIKTKTDILKNIMNFTSGGGRRSADATSYAGYAMEGLNIGYGAVNLDDEIASFNTQIESNDFGGNNIGGYSGDGMDDGGSDLGEGFE